MKGQLKPFQFLKERVQVDIQVWHDLHQELFSSGGANGVEVPMAGLDVSGMTLESIEAVFTEALDHVKAATRGQAWGQIFQMTKSAELRDNVTRVAQRMIVERFQIVPSSVLEQVVEIWLNGIGQLISELVDRTRWETHHRQHLVRLAGSDLSAMESSTEGAMRFLDHPDPDRRIAAITIVEKSGKNRKTLIPLLVEKVVADPDLGVKVTALRVYINYNQKVRDAEVSQFLASIVRDVSAPIPLRDSAYGGLYKTNDRPALESPIVRFAQGRFTFPQDVDWDFVAKCSGE